MDRLLRGSSSTISKCASILSRTYLEVFGHGLGSSSWSPDYECSERHPRLRARSKLDHLQIGLENPPGRYHAGRLEGMFNLAISKSETALAHRSLCQRFPSFIVA